jgi:hypothetical protein
MSNGNGSDGDGIPIKGEHCALDFAGALAHGIASCSAVALADPGPQSLEWSQSAALLRAVLRELRPPNGREIGLGRVPDVVEIMP